MDMANHGYICLIVAVLLAAVDNSTAVNDRTEEIIKYAYSNNGLGAYSFEFQTSNGIYRKEEAGIISNRGTFVIRGEYGYLNPSGQYYSVQYIADANGFQPQFQKDMKTVIRFNDRRII